MPLQDLGHEKEIPLETMALLKVLALTNEEVEKGKAHPVSEAFKRIRSRLIATS